MAKVVLNEAGLTEILRSREVLADLERRAERVAAAAAAVGVRVSGDPGADELPIKVTSRIGSKRAVARVIVAHPAGLAVEAKHRLLGRAMDAARQ